VTDDAGDNCYVWCVHCGVRLKDEEVKGWGCPKCGYQGLPCDPAKDVTVEVNWHELRILVIWAENFARQMEDKSANSSKTVYAIAGRLRRQYPDFEPLTLSEEIAELPRQLEQAGIKAGPIETNVPRPKPIEVNGPGAVGHSH
jgi:hypothetical protein